MFDLHTLQVFTAGGSNSDLSIPGLKADTAARIKEFIIKKTAAEGTKMGEEEIATTTFIDTESITEPMEENAIPEIELTINIETENKEELS